MTDIIAPLPFILTNGTTADATQVMADLNEIRNDINVQVPLAIATQSAGVIIPQKIETSNYTTILSDSGKHIFHPSADVTARTWTIDSNANVPYPIGTVLTFANQHGAGVITIVITSDTMRFVGNGDTASRLLAADGIATILKTTATEWMINGVGIT